MTTDAEGRIPRTFLQGMPVEDYPDLPPEALRGRVLRITEVGEEVLHRPCRDVETFGAPELVALVDDMFATMTVAEGVGLAANQVGVDLRLFVYDLTDDDGDRHVGHVANPVLEIGPVDDTEELDEGCLSVPGPARELFRPVRAAVTGVDVHGRPVRVEGEGYLARALQHEVGHLDGLLYLDLLSKRARKAVLAEMSEARRGVLDRRRELALALGKEPALYPPAS